MDTNHLKIKLESILTAVVFVADDADVEVDDDVDTQSWNNNATLTSSMPHNVIKLNDLNFLFSVFDEWIWYWLCDWIGDSFIILLLFDFCETGFPTFLDKWIVYDTRRKCIHNGEEMENEMYFDSIHTENTEDCCGAHYSFVSVCFYGENLLPYIYLFLIILNWGLNPHPHSFIFWIHCFIQIQNRPIAWMWMCAWLRVDNIMCDIEAYRMCTLSSLQWRMGTSRIKDWNNRRRTKLIQPENEFI